MPDAAVILPDELLAGLDELAASTGRQRADLAREAVAKYLDYERWATEHIREGLRQARAGEFASEEEMAAIFGDGPPATEGPR